MRGTNTYLIGYGRYYTYAYRYFGGRRIVRA